MKRWAGALGVAIVWWAAACSCGSDDAREDGGTSGILTATEPTTAGTGTGGCPAERDCPEMCCADGEVCQDEMCVLDCGAEDPCGFPAACCGADEICYAGTCVVPGANCQAGACATAEVDAECADGEVCDPALGVCVPTQASPDCVFIPPPGVFDPVPLFTWGVRRQRACMVDADCQIEEMCQNGFCAVTWPHVDIAMNDEPNHQYVTSLPVVADLDGDCVPEIMFNSYTNGAFTANGILRAIRGDTGQPVWTLSDPMWRTDGTGNAAAGDIDGDGLPEVIVHGAGNYLIAVDGDGTPLWRSDNYAGPGQSGSPSIVNLDNDGDPEIVFGAAVYDNQGALIWEGTGGAGHNVIGPISCVADLDGDGRQEIIGGRTAYTFTGTVAGGNLVGSQMWESGFADGYCGVADFNADGTPEVVLIRGGTIRVLETVLGTQLASIAIPGTGEGGAPNIADFDGDGRPDIGTAGGANYVVVTFDGVATMQVLWRATTEDDSSSRTGSSVFDFDGDGRAEVVYADEEFLRIYPGIEPDCALAVPGPACDGIMTDAEVLLRDINSSRTRSEYPVVADVNGDFKAEIVFITSNEPAFPHDPATLGDTGVEVWKDRLDNWMPTRPIWNQHTYHVTNVGERGSIPLMEAPNWTTPAGDPHNSYRTNVQGDVEGCAPDLVPQDLQGDFSACPGLDLSVFVVNRGCLGVGPGVNVAFYEATLGLLGVVQTVGPIAAGGAEQVGLSLPDQGQTVYDVRVVVDDDGMGGGALNECDEANNESVPIPVCMPVG